MNYKYWMTRSYFGLFWMRWFLMVHISYRNLEKDTCGIGTDNEILLHLPKVRIISVYLDKTKRRASKWPCGLLHTAVRISTSPLPPPKKTLMLPFSTQQQYIILVIMPLEYFPIFGKASHSERKFNTILWPRLWWNISPKHIFLP